MKRILLLLTIACGALASAVSFHQHVSAASPRPVSLSDDCCSDPECLPGDPPPCPGGPPPPQSPRRPR